MPSSRPIQNLSTGFLSLLGIKNMGKLPENLPDSVQPVINMAEWYKFAEARQQIVQEILGAGSAFTGFLLPLNAIPNSQGPPDGEAWWVHEATAMLAFDAAEPTVNVFGLMSCASFESNAGSTVLLGNPNTTTGSFSAVPTNGAVICAPSIRDFFAPPGTKFGMSATHVSATNAFEARAMIRYTPLKI